MGEMTLGIQRQSEQFDVFADGPRFARERTRYELPAGLAGMLSGPRIQAGLLNTRTANRRYAVRALYTDGSPVQEGDQVRFHQTPGGLMAPSSDAQGNIIWDEGVAAKYPYDQEMREQMLASGTMDPDELHLLKDDGRYYHMAPHIIERLSEVNREARRTTPFGSLIAGYDDDGMRGLYGPGRDFGPDTGPQNPPEYYMDEHDGTPFYDDEEFSNPQGDPERYLPEGDVADWEGDRAPSLGLGGGYDDYSHFNEPGDLDAEVSSGDGNMDRDPRSQGVRGFHAGQGQELGSDWYPGEEWSRNNRLHQGAINQDPSQRQDREVSGLPLHEAGWQNQNGAYVGDASLSGAMPGGPGSATSQRGFSRQSSGEPGLWDQARQRSRHAGTRDILASADRSLCERTSPRRTESSPVAAETGSSSMSGLRTRQATHEEASRTGSAGGSGLPLSADYGRGYDPYSGENLDARFAYNRHLASFREARSHTEDGPTPVTAQVKESFGVMPQQQAIPMSPGHGYVPGHRIGLPWRDKVIPGTVTGLEGQQVGIRWDDGQHSMEEPSDLRPLY